MNKLMTFIELDSSDVLELWYEDATGFYRVKWKDGKWFNTRIDKEWLAEDILSDMARCFNAGYNY